MELLVALSIIALLLSIAAPRYIGNVSRAEENVLRENLFVMRDAIHKFYGDRGHYPEHLDDLVKYRYLRALPVDPVTRSAESWIAVAPAKEPRVGVSDVKSGAKGKAQDGSSFSEW